jgi:sensor domain CHASE-containing protein
MTWFKDLWSFAKTEEQKAEAEITLVEQLVKRQCSACGEWVEHFVSRECAGTKCHGCAGVKK